MSTDTTANTNRKQLNIFYAVACGLPLVLGGLMWYAYSNGTDVSAFAAAQMFYPAAGAILAALLTRKGDTMLPKRFFTGFMVLTGALILLVTASAFVPLDVPEGQLAPWNMFSQGLMILGSVVLLILLLTEKKDKRAAYGLRGGRWKTTALITLLFLALYILRAVIFAIIDGEMNMMLENARNPQSWIMLGVLLPNFFLVFSAFLGEEYGWRYYLQPELQKKLGMTRGVLVIGLIWGLWHLPLNFLYYTTPSAGVISLAAQIITCVALGIFIGWAYLKTDNIWVAVIIHYANNNLVPVISGNYSPSVLQNQEIFWSDVGYSLIVDGLLFAVFLLSPYFRKNGRRLPTMDERAGQ